MLNKPKFMKPSTNKEECTIDLAADKIPFSCIVDGNESITKWQIKIYDITNNEEVFKTEEITLKSSFYPVDEKNRNVVFLVDLANYMYDESGSLKYPDFTNREEAYYWTITLWGSSGNSTTSYQEVFYANKTPTIGLNLNDGDTLTSKDYTFKATYEQENGVQIKRYGWKITDTDIGQVLVDTITKNQIYGSADNIICYYDGFLNGSNYSVELYVETQNNTKITSSFNFSVSYATTFLSNDFNVEALKNEPAIMLDWSKANVIVGILKEDSDKENIVDVDDTIFKTNYPADNQCSIEIPKNFKVEYNDKKSLNFDIDENSYIAFSTQLLQGDSATLFYASGTIAEGYENAGDEIGRILLYSRDSGEFKYIITQNAIEVASATYEVTSKPSEYVWYNFFMSPLIKAEDGKYAVEFNVYEGVVENCIYPSENLYPMATEAWIEAGCEHSEDKDGNKQIYPYPVFGDWNNLIPNPNDTGTEV